MGEHEHRCFSEAMGESIDSIERFSLLYGVPDPEALANCQAVLIGGSGDYNARLDEPWLHDAMAFIRDDVIEPGKPTFGVCFGLQMIGRAMGTPVVHDVERREVGTFEVHTTEAVRDCPLFGDLPTTFLAQQGHNDLLIGTPEGTIKLCENETVPVQAFAVEGKPTWATQFHPELDEDANRTRYVHYIINYSEDVQIPDDDPVIASLRPSEQSTALLRRFAELVLGGRIG